MGIVGNCSYQALIDGEANVCWLCWPAFDSSFVFGNLIDKQKGGSFSISSRYQKYKSRQYYLTNTNVFCTEIEAADGKFRITDFAPRFFQFERYYRPLMLIRKIEPLQGNPSIRVACNPVGNYGKISLKRSEGSNHIEFRGLERELRLTTNISLMYITHNQNIVLNEEKYLVLTFGPPLEAGIKETAETFLSKTIAYWRGWVKNMTINSFHQKEVIRSALTLKIHQYEDTGAITAAATTSLPEFPGSGRNWDYRFCWMRDAFYTLTAFNNIGHFEELENYFHFITNISGAPARHYQPLYSITGESILTEKKLKLAGYLNNKPVRVGNAAYMHTQNDVYGQILVSLLPLYIDNRFIDRERGLEMGLVTRILNEIEARMEQPDAGIWEFREFEQFHCYTYLFHWAGSNAAFKIACQREDEKLKSKALKLMKSASRHIEKCWDREKKVYTQAIGNSNLDSSTLQLILMNYLDPKSSKASQHLEGLEKILKEADGLFYRYKHIDGFGQPESTFLVCGFWYAETLACIGKVEESVKAFEYLLKFSNRHGLFSEDVDAKTGSQWGNFPQTYSHVGLVNAAYRIDRKLDKPNFL